MAYSGVSRLGRRFTGSHSIQKSVLHFYLRDTERTAVTRARFVKSRIQRREITLEIKNTFFLVTLPRVRQKKKKNDRPYPRDVLEKAVGK